MTTLSFDRDMRFLGDTDRLKRKGALQRLLHAVRQPDVAEWDASKLRSVTVECLRRFEDTAEGCRELAINIVAAMVPLQRPEIMDYIMPSVAARIGTEPIREESEELRLRLLELAVLCLDTFPNDLGSFIDFFPVILSNCIADNYPDLKRAACAACARLCDVEPKRVKSFALNLAKAVKAHGLNHKHAAVRGEAIRAFGALVAHGAADILGDTKDEQDNRTTVFALYQLANDRSEVVRRATIDVLSLILLDITDRHDQPRRVLPFVLSLLTDPLRDIQILASSLLFRLGKLYEVDHADNRIDLDKRRITIKDVEWYADDEPVDMTIVTSTPDICLPPLTERPSLAARYVVAEHVRSFLDSILSDATAVNWTIPHSGSNRRTVALRTLAMIIFYSENNVVQYAQQILHALYKVVRDEDKEVRSVGLLCAELMGKFMTVDQYLPFLVARTEDEEDGSTKQIDRHRIVTLVNADGTPSVGSSNPPTLFSTAGNVTKASILTVMRLLLLGARRSITVEQAKMVVKALTDPSLANLDAPDLMSRLVEAQLSVCHMLIDRGYIVATVAPSAARTLDSMLVYAMLAATACETASVTKMADAAIAEVSRRLLGDDRAIYGLHFARWINRHLTTMPPEALTRLIENTPNLTEHASFLVDIFCARLGNIQYNMRVTAELNFFNILRSVLASHRLVLTAEQLEALLRSVILPQLPFRPGPTPRLFRKVAFAALNSIMNPIHRSVIRAELAADEGALTEKLASLWLNGLDSDDAEVRWSCVDCLDSVCQLPLRPGAASDTIDHLIHAFNDTNDQIRLRAAQQLRSLLYANDGIEPTIVAAVHTKLGTLVKTLLIHMDDHIETVGIREEICAILKRVKGINRELVHSMVLQERSKHHTTLYCDEILQFEPNQ